MTDLFEDIKIKGIKASPRSAETGNASQSHPALEIKAPKRGRGRPKKEATKSQIKTPDMSTKGQGKSDKVTYLSKETKVLLQQVKAMMLISTGQSLDESAIVALALDCFIEQHNIIIK